MGSSIVAGLYYENQLQSNPSSDVNAGSLDSDGTEGDVGSGDGIGASAVSFAWVSNLMKGVQSYVSYRDESIDGIANDDDVTAIIAGARVKF